MRPRSLPALILLILLTLCTALAVPAADSVKSTTYYNLHYSNWESVANALTPYLDAAFTTSRDVLGYSNSGYGKIDVYFYSNPRSGTAGYTTPGENALYLNLYYGSSTSDAYLRDYGSTVAHETSHVFFFHQTSIQNRYSWDSAGGSAWTWITESLSYYVGDVVYPYGSQYGKAALGSLLSYYSKDGSLRYSWQDSGGRYKVGAANALDLVQLETIGQFLAERGGWGSIQGMLRNLAAGNDFDTAFKKSFGLETGMASTASGSGVNTLYSEYIKYYLGHY